MSDPDAIVCGAGPNGLVAANLLADEGWDVLVLEAAPEPGGGVRSTELMEPGFTNDVCSAFYPFGAASPVLRDLRLEEFGLQWRESPFALAHPALDGSCPVIARDVEATAESLDAYAPGDGAAWLELYGRWKQFDGAIVAALMAPFPPVRAAARVIGKIAPREWAELIRFLLLPVRRMGDEHFSGEPARRLLAGTALHADLGPEANLSGFFGWLMCCLGHEFGFPAPEGGAQSLTDALVRRLVRKGGRLECATPVDAIVVRDGRAVGVRAGGGEAGANRAVLADVSAPVLYRSLLNTDVLPVWFLHQLEGFQWDNATVKVDWNLDAPIPWAAEPARRAGVVHIADDVDVLTRANAELACGAVPADPFLVLGQQSMVDPTRQPPGKEAAWAYTHVPHPVELRRRRRPPLDVEPLVERMEAAIELRAPGFRDRIRARHVMTPEGFERENPSLVGGALNAGTAQLHQQLIFRPVPGLGRPETPVRGLFLASASAHPGGGVHGAPGANAARAAIMHDRFRRFRTRSTVFRASRPREESPRDDRRDERLRATSTAAARQRSVRT